MSTQVANDPLEAGALDQEPFRDLASIARAFEQRITATLEKTGKPLERGRVPEPLSLGRITAIASFTRHAFGELIEGSRGQKIEQDAMAVATYLYAHLNSLPFDNNNRGQVILTAHDISGLVMGTPLASRLLGLLQTIVDKFEDD